MSLFKLFTDIQHFRCFSVVFGMYVSAKLLFLFRFKSSLTNKEIETSFDGVDFFSEIMEGLNEALAYEKAPSLVDILLQ